MMVILIISTLIPNKISTTILDKPVFVENLRALYGKFACVLF